LLRSTLGGTGLNEHNITVFDNVLLTLGHHLTLGLDLSFVAELLQDTKVIDNGLDKRLLKVGVNDTSSLRRLGAVADRPLTDLIGSASKEAAQLQRLSHLRNQLRQGRVSANGLHLLLGSCLRLKASKSLLVRHRDGDDGVALSILLDPLGDLGEMLVLLAHKVLLGQIDKVDNRLGRQEEERVDDLDLTLLC
jgi:hypothetical protein